MSASDIAFDYPKVSLGGGSPPVLPPAPRRWASPPHGKPEPSKPVAAGAVLARPSAHRLHLIARRYAWHRLQAELKTWRAEFAAWRAEQAPQPDAEPVAVDDRPRVARPWRAWQDGRELRFEYVTGNEED